MNLAELKPHRLRMIVATAFTVLGLAAAGHLFRGRRHRDPLAMRQSGGIWFLLLGLLLGGCGVGADSPATLKIGVLGVMSGPSRSWGLTNLHCAMVTAEMYNRRGGLEVGEETYRIEVLDFDTALDPERALDGARTLVAEGVRYLIGPNVDETALNILPFLAEAGAMNVSFGSNRRPYSPPQANSLLGMAASYQSAPIIYDYLRRHRGVRTVSFIAGRSPFSIYERNVGIGSAVRVGLTIREISARHIRESTYEPGSGGATGLLDRYVRLAPDLIVLSGVTPDDAPNLIRRLRELGYRGLVSTETAQEAAKLRSGAGEHADGFIAVNGMPPPDQQSDYMAEFRRLYVELTGEWIDEAGTKAYTLETVLRTIQLAGERALDDVEVFKRAIERFDVQDPFFRDPRRLRYAGLKDFRQRRQIGLPVVISEFRDGRFEILHIEELPP